MVNLKIVLTKLLEILYPEQTCCGLQNFQNVELTVKVI